MKRLTGAAALLLTMNGCGEKEEKKDEPVITYATVEVANAPTTNDVGDTTIAMTGQTECNFDAETGLFRAAFTAGDNKPTLSVRIKGFKTSSGSYSCTQASDNTSGPVGAKYDGCMVELQTSYSADAATRNTYVMHRASETLTDMTYTGTCTVDVTYEKPKVTGAVTCTKMVQSHLNGKERNPFDANITADVAAGSTFTCDHN